MGQFGDHLARIEAGLVALGRHRVVEALGPGLEGRRVRDALAAAGLEASDEMVELYCWRNGTALTQLSLLDDVQMFPGFYFLCLEDALTNLRAFRSDIRWDSSWLPVFANGGGDFYVIDCSLPACPVRHFRLEQLEHPVEFTSLGSMIATIAEAMDSKVFFVAADGYFEMDDDEFGRLAADLNPDVRWWSS